MHYKATSGYEADVIIQMPTSLLLSKSNEVLVVGIHVRQLAVDEETDLVLAPLFLLPYVSGDDPLGLFAETGVAVHLRRRREFQSIE